MKNNPHLRYLALLIAVCFALSKPVIAFAQEGYSLLIMLSVLQASPGATIEVTGSHFEPDILVSFALFQNGNQTDLGSFAADDHGDFVTSVLLPFELPLGEYEFRGVDEKGNFAAVPLFIVPDPHEEEDGEAREEEDPLLAPMPTYPPDESVTPMAVAQSLDDRAAPASSFPWMIIVVAGAAVAVLFLALLFARKRGS